MGNVIGMFVMLGLLGIIVGMGGGYYIADIQGMMIGAFAGFMPFIAVMQIIGYAKNKGFLALFKTLEPNEKYIWVPNKLNKIMLFIMKKSHKDVLTHKQLGIFEDKGTEFALGNSPMGFAFPHSAYTVDFPTIHYFSKNEDKEDGVDDYEDMVYKYLGDTKYKQFYNKFRGKDKTDYYSIINEINWLIQNPPTGDNGGDAQEQVVFGETVDFRNRLKYLRYNYDPITAENATERERILALKEGMDYREPDRYMSKAKAISVVLMAIMILVVVFSVVDVGAIFGG